MKKTSLRTCSESIDAVIARTKICRMKFWLLMTAAEIDTLAKARRYAGRNGHVKVVSYSENVGKGHAVKTGFMQSNGNVVDFCGQRHGNRFEQLSQNILKL